MFGRRSGRATSPSLADIAASACLDISPLAGPARTVVPPGQVGNGLYKWNGLIAALLEKEGIR